MGHDKLRKFAENEGFACLLQPSSKELLQDGYFALRDHEIKGCWNEWMFEETQPIVLELGCGKGEYTIDLSRRIPSRNYVGVDIKGARLWKGAKYAHENELDNVAFLRTRIEFITAFFAPSEISQIWLTFSDPQMKSENSRLTSPLFLERYRKFLRPGGLIHLKTDSMFLHQYTKAVALKNGLRILACTEDLYATPADALFSGQQFSSSSAPVSVSPVSGPSYSAADPSSSPVLSAASGPVPVSAFPAFPASGPHSSPALYTASGPVPVSASPASGSSFSAAPHPQDSASDQYASIAPVAVSPAPAPSSSHSQVSISGPGSSPTGSLFSGLQFAQTPAYASPVSSGQTPATAPPASSGTESFPGQTSQLSQDEINSLYEVQTFYEKMFLEQGCKITYLCFTLDHDGPFEYPDFDAAYWRSVEGPRRSFDHK